MCGIVGLYLKNAKLHSRLGEMFTPMLVEMTSRGPDSAGVAIYRDTVKRGLIKLTLAHDNPKFPWKSVDAGLERALKCDARLKVIEASTAARSSVLAFATSVCAVASSTGS